MQPRKISDNLNKEDLKYNSKLKWNSDWKHNRKKWFKKARWEADKEIKDSNPKQWKKMKMKHLHDQMTKLDS